MGEKSEELSMMKIPIGLYTIKEPLRMELIGILKHALKRKVDVQVFLS